MDKSTPESDNIRSDLGCFEDQTKSTELESESNKNSGKERKARTAYVKGFPLDSDQQTIETYFKNFVNVEEVTLRTYTCKETDQKLFKGSVFVTFSNLESAEEFVDMDEVKYNEETLLKHSQSKYFELKKQDLALKKQELKNKKDSEASHDLPKRAVVHFALESDCEISREDIKARVYKITPTLEIAFINFKKGDMEGDIRFVIENDGQKFIDKLRDERMKVKEVELICNLLEGKAEEKFLKKSLADLQDIRTTQKKAVKGRKIRSQKKH